MILRFSDVPTLVQSKANIVGALLGALTASLLAAAVVFGALAVSNTLTFGPFGVGQYLGDAVTLTESRGLSSAVVIDEENEIRFVVQASKPINDAILWFQLQADLPLDDPNIVQLSYEHLGGGGAAPVTLTATSDGKLKGLLKSRWNIPVGSVDGEGKIKFIFLNNAPTDASYSADIWVEIDNAAPSPPTTTTSVSIGDNFFSPETVYISAGDTVTWTWAGGGVVPHTTTGTGSASWDSGVRTAGSYSRTFNNVGTFSYVCEIHSSDMVGTITVEP